MTCNSGPLTVNDNLLLNLDLANPRRFSNTLGAGNLVTHYFYNVSSWTRYFPENNTLITGIDAPDGSRTAVRLVCRTSGSSLLRAGLTGFTPNGTDVYAISFWVRSLGGTTATPSNQLTSDLHDGIGYNYINDLVTNKWVRIVYTGTPTATFTNFLDLLSDRTTDYTLDFWGVKVENLTADNPYPIIDSRGGYTFNVYRPHYTRLDQDIITFDRTGTPSKFGGLAFTVGTGSLLSSNFLYNDHTWEVWFRINDISAIGTVNEGTSVLASYSGFHSGFQYSATTMFYYIWNGGSIGAPCTWTVGTSGTQIIQGQWYQIAVVRSGNSFTPYVNGVASGSAGTFATPTVNVNVSNNIHIGATARVAAGDGNYLLYSKNTVSNLKMYNRALTATEIQQNFQATRRRYSI